ncbi:hypothetical protein NGI46_13835 [Peribacillus butanolivorans]|uniref:hypothetical protein n=1 Tax=Peribacillus butanolivorans TaxID=421767 RepID=UPI00207CA33F|nr:hypothetical protein [Peribacillus butanolivorans]MCO0598514.1 hypothetical protein [Peribacillus butanolivorans]
MNISMILKNDSFVHTANLNSNPLYDILIDLQETKEILIDLGDKTYRDDRLYMTQFFAGVELYKILFEKEYQKEAGITVEEVKMLNKVIEQNSSIENNEYDKIVNDILQDQVNEPYALLCCYLTNTLPFHANTPNTLLNVRRELLLLTNDLQEFITACPLCFPNLYFHSNLVNTLRSLSAPFPKFKFEIIRHLTAINDIFHPLYKENRNGGINDILKVLKAEGELSCSLEGNAESARKRLTFEFKNKLDIYEELVCEPHTKLEGTGNPGDTEYKYDRIYFHGGKESIADGKTLIAHIGEHL